MRILTTYVISGPEWPRCRKMAQVPKSNPGLISVPAAWPPARNPFVVNLQQTGLSRQARNRSGTASGQKIRKKLDFGGRPQTCKFLSLNRCLLMFFCVPCGGTLSGGVCMGRPVPTRSDPHRFYICCHFSRNSMMSLFDIMEFLEV